MSFETKMHGNRGNIHIRNNVNPINQFRTHNIKRNIFHTIVLRVENKKK